MSSIVLKGWDTLPSYPLDEVKSLTRSFTRISAATGFVDTLITVPTRGLPIVDHVKTRSRPQ